MNEAEKEVFEKLKADFLRIKKKSKLNSADEEQLNTDITGMLGLFAVIPELIIADYAEKMISFGEEKLLAMQGHRIQFDKLKRKHKIR